MYGHLAIVFDFTHLGEIHAQSLTMSIQPTWLIVSNSMRLRVYSEAVVAYYEHVCRLLTVTDYKSYYKGDDRGSLSCESCLPLGRSDFQAVIGVPGVFGKRSPIGGAKYTSTWCSTFWVALQRAPNSLQPWPGSYKTSRLLQGRYLMFFLQKEIAASP